MANAKHERCREDYGALREVKAAIRAQEFVEGDGRDVTGRNLLIAPYRGTAPGLADVAAGHVQLMIDSGVVLLPMARGGQIKALPITAAKRSALAPDIPTAAESGMPGLEFASWYGIWGPRGVPNEAVQWLNAAANEATRDLATKRTAR